MTLEGRLTTGERRGGLGSRKVVGSVAIAVGVVVIVGL